MNLMYRFLDAKNKIVMQGNNMYDYIKLTDPNINHNSLNINISNPLPRAIDEVVVVCFEENSFNEVASKKFSAPIMPGKKLTATFNHMTRSLSSTPSQILVDSTWWCENYGVVKYHNL